MPHQALKRLSQDSFRISLRQKDSIDLNTATIIYDCIIQFVAAKKAINEDVRNLEELKESYFQNIIKD